MQFFTGGGAGVDWNRSIMRFQLMSGPGLRDAVGIRLQNPKISPPGRKFRVSQSVSNVGEQGVGF
jgi:hypothetical protein